MRKFAFFQFTKSRQAVLTLASLLLMIYPALIACSNISNRLSRWPPSDPWAAAEIVEGWRASSHMPVYEPHGVGHATLVYGPAEPLVLGWAFKIFGPTRLIPQLLSVGGALWLVLLGWLIVRPFLTLMCQCLAILSLIAIECGVTYYSEGRPDYPAWAISFSGLLLTLYGGHHRSLRSLLIGSILITAGVCFKQTAAMLVIVPSLVLLCDSNRHSFYSFLLSLTPIVFVSALFLYFYAFTPELYYYMMVLPRLYPVSLHAWLKYLGEFIAGAVSLWFGLGWLLAAGSPLSQFGSKWWQHTCWMAVTFIVTVLGGTLTMAKYGGWYNSLIPSWFSLITLSWLLLAPYLGFSQQNVRGSPKGFQTLLSTVIIIITIFHGSNVNGITPTNPLTALRNFLTALRIFRTANQDNKEYADVISQVQTLQGNVLSIEDPTITLFAKDKIDRSIYLEYDLIVWPDDELASTLPQSLVDELSNTDYVVHLRKTRPNPIESHDLESLGFEMYWSNDSYSIWKARRR